MENRCNARTCKQQLTPSAELWNCCEKSRCKQHLTPSVEIYFVDFYIVQTKKSTSSLELILLMFWQLASIKFLVKCFYSTSSSMDTLFTAVERMALRADFYFNIMFRSRSGFEFITASADNFYSLIFWVNTFFHPLHLFLLEFPNCTLHLVSIIFSAQLVNDFFTDFSFFCEKVWCNCQWPPAAILPLKSAKKQARPMVLPSATRK